MFFEYSFFYQKIAYAIKKRQRVLNKKRSNDIIIHIFTREEN